VSTSTSLSADDGLHRPEFQSPPTEPMLLARSWLDAAEDHDVSEPLSMTLATASADGIPHARTVDVKSIDPDGLVFGTSEDSPKGHDLTENPNAALQVYWRETKQQLRFEGRVVRLGDEESDALFASRSPKSQAATAVADQSAPFPADEPDATIDALIEHANDLLEEHGDDVPRPDAWRAWRLEPTTVEFWQSSRDRMHRRIGYRRATDGWTVVHLQP
jgi:pyridoxamine 5'-phosphate oxidase